MKTGNKVSTAVKTNVGGNNKSKQMSSAEKMFRNRMVGSQIKGKKLPTC